jgi:hypothetical protein
LRVPIISPTRYYLDFKSNNKLDWNNVKLNLNSEWNYGVIGKNIILSGNGQVVDLNIVSKDEIKFIQSGIEYVYRK